MKTIEERMIEDMARRQVRQGMTRRKAAGQPEMPVREQVNLVHRAINDITNPKPARPPVMSQRFTPISPEYEAMKERHR